MLIEEIRSVADLANVAFSAKNHFNKMIWYRGHASDNWKLQPSIFRETFTPANETTMAMGFVNRAQSLHSSCPSLNDRPGWLALMRHYGLPTRLLDWSHSILVAAFFAVGMEWAHGDAVIWCLSPGHLNLREVKTDVICAMGGELALPTVSGAFDFASNDRVIATHTPEVDHRMMLQQSGFTVHGRSEPLETFADADQFLSKFVIPDNYREKLAQELNVLGFTLSNVFMDLGHLAQQLAADCRGALWRRPPSPPPGK